MPNDGNFRVADPVNFYRMIRVPDKVVNILNSDPALIWPNKKITKISLTRRKYFKEQNNAILHFLKNVFFKKI